MADPTAVLPTPLADMFRCPTQAHVTYWPDTFSEHAEKNQHRWTGRSARWKIRGHSVGRRFDQLRKSLGRVVRVDMHALQREDGQHGETQSRLWWRLSRPTDHQSAEYNPLATVSDRVRPCTKAPDDCYRMGWATPGQCAEVRKRISGHSPKCSATRLRPEQISHERGRVVQALVSPEELAYGSELM